MNNYNGINFGAYFEAIIMEKTHIQSPTFKVTIPALFSTRDKITSTKEEDHKISYDLENNTALINSNVDGSGSIKSTTVLIAKNHTDYIFQYKGDVLEMEKSEGETELSGTSRLVKRGFWIFSSYHTETNYHKHDIKKPFKFYNMVYEQLNNVEVPAGTKCWGFFINGQANFNNFAVVRIDGAIPMSKNPLPNYVK